MDLPEPLSDTIAAVAAVLADARDPWWILSGAAAALYGARPITVSDVDVMLSVRDAERLFARIGIVQEPPSGHPRFRSERFGRWTAPPLVVEFMAGFLLRDRDGAWRPMQPDTRRLLRVGAAIVFVPEMPELRAMFARIGRPKDQVRIALLDRLPA